MSAADIVLPAYYFLNDLVGFKWYGVSFAGLGGMGWEILVGNQNSIFEEGNISRPRRGMTPTMIHELGHSLGLPHPHSGAYGWGGAFVGDVMSYYAPIDSFSSFYRDAIGRAHSDGYYFFSQEELVQAEQYFHDAGEPSAYQELFTQLLATLTSRLKQHDAHETVDIKVEQVTPHFRG